MSLYQNYRKNNSLETVSFIAGSNYTLKFPCYNETGEALNISSSTMKWFLSPYSQPEYTLLEKECNIINDNSFSLTLSHDETMSLGGVYLQQIEITEISGEKIRPAQGIVIIAKAIGN